MVATLVLEASVERRESSSLSLPTKVLFQSSTAVVQLTVNQLVVGSIPASGARKLGDSMSDGGKGCKARPFSVDKETFSTNWDAIFNKKKKTEQEKFDESIIKNEYYDLDRNED